GAGVRLSADDGQSSADQALYLDRLEHVLQRVAAHLAELVRTPAPHRLVDHDAGVKAPRADGGGAAYAHGHDRGPRIDRDPVAKLARVIQPPAFNGAVDMAGAAVSRSHG